MEQSVFNSRLTCCKKCEFWRGACTKGHALRGDLGCPLKRFDGIAGAGHMLDVPAEPQLPPSGGSGCCGGGPAGIRPLTWPVIWQQLRAAERRWREAGHPVADELVYEKRKSMCRACPQYQWFQCKRCACVVALKAKLATESCPDGKW